MTKQEAELILDGYHKRIYDGYKQTQLLMYAICQVQTKKKLDPEKLMPLKIWEDEIFNDTEYESENEISQESYEETRKRVMAKVDMYKNIAKNMSK